jgi:octaheme c-type cytochrome (tetrathionate reductase family)
MKKRITLISALILLFFAFSLYAQDSALDSARVKVMNYVYKSDRLQTQAVDHTQFEVLQQDFENAHDVTAACLSCHNQRDKEVMMTSHWKWQREEELEGKGVVPLGKRNILNNFCIGVSASEGTCTRCHIGYGWHDKSFDFGEPTNIDCLVCHDNSGEYKKGKGMAGYPAEEVNLAYVAQRVGAPKKENCGVCHFWGGGGNNVKHGDLDKAMLDCSREVDVHMTTEGEDMTCTDCHITDKHQMAGKLYALSSENINRVTCEQCHTATPHNDNMIDQHYLRVACQTCHIPVYAKVNSTKMIWDWSNAGELDENGNPKHENDADGYHAYLSIKGRFVWDDQVVPEYYWFNGIANHQLITDNIDTIPVQMNSLDGAYRDKGRYQKTNEPSKIWPVKVHRGRQIYDPVNMTLIQPKLWDPEVGTGAYWKDFDWGEAAQRGMDYLDLPYSGEYDFVETDMYWPLNHQVSPKEASLQCIDCHTRNGGRLAELDDFYLPGRDQNANIEVAGITLIILAFVGVLVHLGCRLFLGGNCKLNN